MLKANADFRFMKYVKAIVFVIELTYKIRVQEFDLE
jgi:hypothetical protein